MENEITDEEVLDLMLNRGLTFEKVVNVIVDTNHIIGVGLITLAQTFYIYTVLNKSMRKPGITREEIDQLINNYRIKHKFN